MKLISILVMFISVSVFANTPIAWKCTPAQDIMDAGFYISLSDSSSFPFADVSEMTITGSKKIYSDYLYRVDDPTHSINSTFEYRDLYSNGRSLILIINTAETNEKGFQAVLKLADRPLGDLSLLSCKKL